MSWASYPARKDVNLTSLEPRVWVTGGPPETDRLTGLRRVPSACLPQDSNRTATATRPQGARKLRDANPTHFSAHQPCLHAVCPFPHASPSLLLPLRSLAPSLLCRGLNEDIMTTTGAGRIRPRPLFLALALCMLLFCAGVHASVGDRLPEFRQCVEVCDGSRRRGPYLLPAQRDCHQD